MALISDLRCLAHEGPAAPLACLAVTEPLPQLSRLTWPRANAFCDTVKKYGEADLLKAIQAAGKSSFCRDGGKRGWVADLDWLVKGDHVVKLLEGHYRSDTLAEKNKRAAEESIRRRMGRTAEMETYTDEHGHFYARPKNSSNSQQKGESDKVLKIIGCRTYRLKIR